MIRFKPENKSCLTQWENLKNILKYNPNSSQAYLAHFSPVQPKQPLDMYEGARV